MMRFDWQFDWIVPLLAEGEEVARGQQGSLFDMLGPFAIIGVIFYFLLIRPESKRRKERLKMIDALKKGDRVLTNGGLIAKVAKVADGELILRIDADKDVKVHFSKNSILEVLDTGDGSVKNPSDDAVCQLEQQAKS